MSGFDMTNCPTQKELDRFREILEWMMEWMAHSSAFSSSYMYSANYVLEHSPLSERDIKLEAGREAVL